jgi:hypothetical protein
MKSKHFLPRVYTDKETERLSKKYEVKTCPNEPLQMCLGQVENEVGAYKLLGLAKIFGEFVGISVSDIDKIETHYDFNDFGYIEYLDERYVRTEKKGNLEILFPNEELLLNQKVKRKSYDR